MGILGVVAIPFGFDAFFWRQKGYGIEWMDTVALWVASLPGVFGRFTSFGTGHGKAYIGRGQITVFLLVLPAAEDIRTCIAEEQCHRRGNSAIRQRNSATPANPHHSSPISLPGCPTSLISPNATGMLHSV